MFVADMHPGHFIDEGTYALLGAASFLGGAMRMTVRSEGETVRDSCLGFLRARILLQPVRRRRTPFVMLPQCPPLVPAAVLGPLVHLQVCTCVMLLELTNNLALLPLIMLVLLVAKASQPLGTEGGSEREDEPS